MDYNTIFEWVGRLVVIVLVGAGVRALFKSRPSENTPPPESQSERMTREYDLDEVSTRDPLLGINRKERFALIRDAKALRKLPLESIIRVEIRQNGRLVVGTDRTEDKSVTDTRRLAFGAAGFVVAGSPDVLDGQPISRLDLLVFTDAQDWGSEINFWTREQDEIDGLTYTTNEHELEPAAAYLKEWYSKLAAIVRANSETQLLIDPAVAAA